MGRPLEPIRHGSAPGWWQERRRGLGYCPDCIEAKHAADAEERTRRRSYQSKYQAEWRRRKQEGRVTVPSVIFDVLETAGTSMSWLSLSGWVLELHPEWTEATVRRTLVRLVKEGRVQRVEFGDELRYRL